MDLGKQKDLASRTLGVSKKRIKFDASTPEKREELKEIISRETVRELKEEGLIKVSPKKGISRTRANKLAEQKKKGRRKGQGSRKGTFKARVGGTKRLWVVKIRALRSLLKKLKDEGKLDTKTFRDLYLKAKGNFFRNKRHMLLYIEQNELYVKKDEEVAQK
jgi:large subunit ribosomal protein L19e